MNPLYRPELVNEPKHKSPPIKDPVLSTDDRVVLKGQAYLIENDIHNPYLSIDKTVFVKTQQEKDAVKKARWESQVLNSQLRKDIINTVINMRCNFNSLSLIVTATDKTEKALKFVA
jgi:hypothetical protein